MFSDYETLLCKTCEKSFTGRKPSTSGDIFCPNCLNSDELPIVNEGEAVPDSTAEEIEGGRGDDFE